MTTRDRFRQIAEENLSIFNSGFYIAPDGGAVSLARQLDAGRAGTVLIDAVAEEAPRQDLTRATFIELTREDTVSAILRLQAAGADGLAVLNFASARSPGGGFLRGGNAQEEALCRASTLYDAVSLQHAFYNANAQSADAVYRDTILYTPDVAVFRDSFGHCLGNPASVAVITAPAPNRRALEEQGRAGSLARTIDGALRRRVALILSAAADHGHSALVLGAWGCGVFGNPPGDVARIFADALMGEYATAFDTVVFAIPGHGHSPNFDAFSEVFAAG